MKTLQKISERTGNVLTGNQMYVCFGGKDTTSGTTKITNKETGETCTYVTTDTYKEGKLHSKCTEFSCE